MGFWGTSLYSNDTTCDVRDSYMNCLSQNMSDEDAFESVCSEYHELFGTDEEILFWFSVADTQWNVGRLDCFVKEKVLDIINNHEWNRWCIENNVNWKKFLTISEKLKKKIILLSLSLKINFSIY